jgi:hypothetical protein
MRALAMGATFGTTSIWSRLSPEAARGDTRTCRSRPRGCVSRVEWDREADFVNQSLRSVAQVAWPPGVALITCPVLADHVAAWELFPNVLCAL